MRILFKMPDVDSPFKPARVRETRIPINDLDHIPTTEEAATLTENAIQKALVALPPEATDIIVVHKSQLPDRSKRNSWDIINGKVVVKE